MSIDPYSLCPGGTGKKIKFCCPDLLGELGDLQQMVEGDQRLACLERIYKLEEKFPDRACLLSVKAMLEAELAETGKAEATVARFKEKYPDNPVALAEEATIKSHHEGGKAAIGALQQALRVSTETLAEQVYNALLAVAERLATDGEYLAAIGHLSLFLALSDSRDQRGMSLLSSLLGSPHLPLLVKEIQPLVPATEGALWAPAFAKAMEHARMARWSDAVRELEDLAKSAGDWPPIWRNIATLRLWLADTPGAVVALRKFARQPLGSSAAPPLEDMVEAEALAQVIDVENADYIDALNISYPVRDADAVIARLSADPRCQKMQIDLAKLAGEDEPPPKLAVWVLDRPVAATGKGITRDTISIALGQVYLYGRQTDREARLELATYRDAKLPESQRILTEIVGDAIGEPTGEEVLSRVSTLKHAVEWSWRLPGDTPPEEREALVSHELRRVFLEDWPAMKLNALDGRTPIEAARDPAMRVPLLAAVLVLELASKSSIEMLDFNELRDKLNLPRPGQVELGPRGIFGVSLARLHRVEAGKLDDEQLLLGYVRAVRNVQVEAIRVFSEELLKRPAEERKPTVPEIYGQLAQIERDPRKAIGYIEQARSAAEAAGQSSAPWDITELTLRLALGQMSEADRLMQHVSKEHIREPGVAQMLMQVLVEAGIIHPDGTPVGYPQGAAEAEGMPAGGTMPAGEAGKLWTPDGGPAPAGEKKSVIWTPE